MTLAAQALDGVAIGQNCSPGTHQGQHAPLIPIASAATSVPYAESAPLASLTANAAN
jgi:hypothetical protein